MTAFNPWSVMLEPLKLSRAATWKVRLEVVSIENVFAAAAPPVKKPELVQAALAVPPAPAVNTNTIARKVQTRFVTAPDVDELTEQMV